MSLADHVLEGADGKLRCSWGHEPEDYAVYHDDEWGHAVTDERTLFEKICLEGFQSGLSWLTILRKRDAFREVFHNFDAARVATFGEADVQRLLDDARIIRHRGKIEATINNAQRLVDLWEQGSGMAKLVWSHEPQRALPAPQAMSDVPASTPESTALSKDLKRQGFRFVGPTTAYAAMQAMGVVNDHLADCHRRRHCEDLRSSLTRP